MSYKYLNITNMSFVKEYLQKRTSKNVFFRQVNIRQVNTLEDWSPIEKELLISLSISFSISIKVHLCLEYLFCYQSQNQTKNITL